MKVSYGEAHGRVDDDGGGELASAEDVVADGEFHVAVELVDALVDAFVTAADEDDTIEGGEFAGDGLGEGATLRGEQDDAGFLLGGVGGAGLARCEAERGEGFRKRLGFEDHAFSAAEGTVVDGAVTVVGEGAEIVDVTDTSLWHGHDDDACSKMPAKKAGKMVTMSNRIVLMIEGVLLSARGKMRNVGLKCF